MAKTAEKILIIRFSSFGDILATFTVMAALRQSFPTAGIHWLTRNDFAEIAQASGEVNQVWSLEKKKGWRGLLQMMLSLRQQNFTHVYDAHNNLRSHMISWALRGPWGLLSLWPTQFLRPKFIRRSQYRWRRFLLFRFHINRYPKPFVHQWALLEPLAQWNVSLELPPAPLLRIPINLQQEAHLSLSNFLDKSRPIVALSPSASYELKRWPVSYWKDLIRQNPHWNFVALGGPDDQFIEEIVSVAAERCLNFSGKLSYLQSAAMVSQADVLVSNDTGLMHVAEQLGKSCVALLGPAPFGYPGRSTTVIKERELYCRPCSKHGQGPCVNKEYQKCMTDISVSEVGEAVQKILAESVKKNGAG